MKAEAHFPTYAVLKLLLCATLILMQTPINAQQGSAVKLNPGDLVQITVFGHEDLSGEFELDAAGRLSLPLIEDISAVGVTLDELEQLIVEELRPDYLINPRVTAQLLSAQPIYILGEVNSPGSYPYRSGMSVVNAVAVAGGYTYRARVRRVVIRRVVDDVQVELRAEPEMEILPGDVIEVPERYF